MRPMSGLIAQLWAGRLVVHQDYLTDFMWCRPCLKTTSVLFPNVSFFSAKMAREFGKKWVQRYVYSIHRHMTFVLWKIMLWRIVDIVAY